MRSLVVISADVAWVLLVVALFRAIGPRRAALIAVFGGLLVLPREADRLLLFDTLTINKRVVSGFALLLGVVCFDPRALIRGRPRLADLPMVAFVLLPLASLASNGFLKHWISIDQVWKNLFEWAMPYLAGRLYFGEREAPRNLSVAIVVSGLLYVPVCLFEMVLGPRYYLLGLVYGISPHGHMVSRLGGWRPEGFLTNGIELATWMALASTTAAWLWLYRGWSPWKAPAWFPSLALTLVTTACRGVFGYATLGIGLVTALLSRWLQTRFLIASLALLAPVYVGVRVSGTWDGHQLRDLAEQAGKGGTVAYRLRAEGAYIQKVTEHGLTLGFGGVNSDIFDFFAQGHLWPDGWWVHQLRSGGLVGLTAFLLAMFLVPAGLGLALPAGRSGRGSPGALAWGLSLFLVLHLLDSLHNMAYLTPTPLLGGSLVALFVSRRALQLDVPESLRATARASSNPPTGSRTPVLVTAVVLAVVEVLGHLPRSPALGPEPSGNLPRVGTPHVDAEKPGAPPGSR